MKNLVKYFSPVIISCGLLACEKPGNPDIPAAVWQKHPLPVLERGKFPDYDFYAISDGYVIREGNVYKMWYTGGGAVLPDETLRSRISYATSVDGIKWEKYTTNPVLDVSGSQWDSLGVETVSVLLDEEADPKERYKMWYAGQTFNDFRYNIGYAVSQDGIHWDKYQNGPVLTVGSTDEWDNGFLEGPSVIKVGSQYKMWYAGYDVSVNGKPTDGKVNIGLAISDDGIQWKKYEGNPVMTTGTGWDAETVQDPHVIYADGSYHMWYGGVNKVDLNGQEIGYAFSEDGISWKKSANNPVLKRGASGSWDSFTASFPSVLIEGEELKIWYTGKNALDASWPDPYYWEIGMARRRFDKELRE
ncbi:hypothetical protein [Dyadobacter sp. NIV53]|uniref:hypothetical protein n=1 Tax=Dyadobacter sp. NIV53 TaxID=2861765 RepID=UPI001C87ACAD|nr:hypothetical protein [Dyadobacter sp. NIV53]